MTNICPICNNSCRETQKSIECKSCYRWVHHNTRGNCSALTNSEFESHVHDSSKFWECDRCYSQSISILPFSKLDEDNWLTFNEIPARQTSDDVNIISADDRTFAPLCEYIQYSVNFENGDDDILLNHVNSKYYDVKQLNSTKIDLPSSFGLFHANAASLNKHIDDLRHI